MLFRPAHFQLYRCPRLLSVKLTVCRSNSVCAGEIQMTEWSYQMFVFFMAHLIAMSSTVYNPFLYAWFNDTFRAQFQKVLPCYRFGSYLVSDYGGRRRGPDSEPSPSRFATGGGWSPADTNHAMSVSVEDSCRHDMMSTASTGPCIELTVVTATSTDNH